jgi:hypothetical protein
MSRKYRFNKAARAEATAGLKKLGGWSAVLSPVFGYVFGGTLPEKAAIAVGSVVLYVVCHVCVVYIAGLEDDKKTKSKPEDDDQTPRPTKEAA